MVLRASSDRVSCRQRRCRLCRAFSFALTARWDSGWERSSLDRARPAERACCVRERDDRTHSPRARAREKHLHRSGSQKS